MAECECLSGCLFFNGKMPIDQGLMEMYKKRYCRGDKNECARYIVRSVLGKDKVPTDLYPNMFEKAKALVQKG
jgi:hypothetical protein